MKIFEHLFLYEGESEGEKVNPLGVACATMD